MRIATWNMAASDGVASREFLSSLECAVLLLTEVPRELELANYALTFSQGDMAQGQAFAAVATRDQPTSRVHPHRASVCAQVGGAMYLASVLPWRSAKVADGFPGGNQGERTREAVETLTDDWPPGPVVWGGDWNHELSGRLGAGSTAGRAAILKAVRGRNLQVPTSVLGAAAGDGSVNHVALPADWTVMSVTRYVAESVGKRLSDHDAYVVDAEPAG